jgi:hypothetical protein
MGDLGGVVEGEGITIPECNGSDFIELYIIHDD